VIEVESGQRTLYVIGMKLAAGSCETLAGSNQLTFSNYSNPFLIGKNEVTLVPGEQDVAITVANTFNNDNKIGDCSFITPPAGTVETTTVQAVYPTYGTNWLDYIKNNNGGTGDFDQPDQACTGSESGNYFSCLHGGEKLKAVIPNVTSCTGITANDDLAAFDWTCIVQGQQALIVSLQLASGKGLQNLVSGSGWIPNKINIYQGANKIAQSTAATWWTNPVVALPATLSAGLTLDTTDDDSSGPDQAFTAGTILVGATNLATHGYNFNMDKLALVLLPGVKMTYAWVGTNYNTSASSGDSSTPTLSAILSGGSQKFNWIEGNFDGYFSGTSANFAGYFKTSKFLRIHKSTFSRSGVEGVKLNVEKSFVSSSVFTDISSHGLILSGTYTSIFADIQSFKNTGNGIWFDGVGSDYNYFYHLNLANNGVNGLRVNAGTTNHFQKLKLHNNGSEGLHMSSALINSIFTDVVISHNGYHGVSMTGNKNTFHQFTVALNGPSASYNEVYATTATDSVLNSFLVHSTYNTRPAMYISSSTGLKLSQLSLDGGSVSLTSASSSNNQYTNNILLNTASCSESGGTGPGINGSCGMTDASDGVVTLSKPTSNSFLAKLTSDEVVNASDSTGQNTFGSIVDWTGFASFYRVWGKDGSAFPNSDNTGRCTNGICRIWDWRLKKTDTSVLNRSNNPTTPEVFVAGSACPLAVHGNKAIDDKQERLHHPKISGIENIAAAGGDDDGICESGEFCSNRFLINAKEIFEDAIGDNDGLCESNEACIYAPNYGAYQGEGDLSGTCSFTDGLVSGVLMKAHLTNGL